MQREEEAHNRLSAGACEAGGDGVQDSAPAVVLRIVAICSVL